MKSFCHDTSMLLGRIMLSAMFLVAGVQKLMNYEATMASMTSEGVPYVGILVIAAIVVETICALMVLVGYRARLGAFMLFIFIIPVTFFYHDFWLLQGEEMTNQVYHFLKNMTIAGGMLYVMANGAGRYSISGQ